MQSVEGSQSAGQCAQQGGRACAAQELGLCVQLLLWRTAVGALCKGS
jgi:hypothetical protein